MIKDLVADANFEHLKVRVLSKNGPRMVGKNRKSFVTDLLIIDINGDTCTMTVWGKKEADEYRVGKIIEIFDGWCKMYNDVKQVSLGRSGSVVHLEKDDPNIPKSINRDE